MSNTIILKDRIETFKDNYSGIGDHSYIPEFVKIFRVIMLDIGKGEHLHNGSNIDMAMVILRMYQPKIETPSQLKELYYLESRKMKFQFKDSISHWFQFTARLAPLDKTADQDMKSDAIHEMTHALQFSIDSAIMHALPLSDIKPDIDEIARQMKSIIVLHQTLMEIES